MFHSPQDAYLENRILSADPLELVRMLYQAAIGAVQDARRHLANAKIAERSKAITRACDVIIELRSALDTERGGEIAVRLAALYEYMLRKLLEANLRQSDALLGEVLSLLSTLAEGWAGISKSSTAEPVREYAWAQPLPEAPAPACVSGSWSF